jgi:uncharacterized membrane protein YgdD (TMEM256/DUF423 family)
VRPRASPLKLQPDTWLLLAAVNGFLAVLAGAFAAHGLEAQTASTSLDAFKTGAQYHMYHALALIAVAWRADRRKGALSIALAGWGFVIGILLFSGSLYVLGVSGSRNLVWLTPLGGVSFLGGWAALVVDVRVKLQKAA